MSLLFMKLKEKYTIKELENIFTRRIVFYMRKNNTPHFTTITQKNKAENFRISILEMYKKQKIPISRDFIIVLQSAPKLLGCVIF